MTRRPLFALILADAAALTGTRLSMIALPWLVLTTLGDAWLAGIVAFAEMAPYVLCKALGGPLIDRCGARRVSVAADLVSVGAVALIPLLAALSMLGPSTLVPVVALIGALRGPADAAKYALVPSVAEAAGVPYSRVTGMVATVERLASTAGAGLAAAIVALIGPANALGLNAVFFALAALAAGAGLRAAKPAPAAAPAPYLRELAEGWRHLRADAVLVAITGMVAVTNLLDQAFAIVLLPVWAADAGAGVETVGLFQMTMAGAAVAGAVAASAWAERLPRLATYAVCFLIVGLPRFAIFVTPLPLGPMLGILALSGFASGFINPIIGAVVFERIPAALTGRVTSLFTAAAWTLMPFGGLLAGGLVAATDIPTTFLVLGLAYLAATMLPLCLRRFRAMDAPPAPA